MSNVAEKPVELGTPIWSRTSQLVRRMNPLLRMSAFLKVFGSAPAARPMECRVPDGIRVYCVGDVHGRDDLLGEMAERISADLEIASFDHAVTVFLGDYVDRGLGSMRVIERLVRSDWPTAIVPLLGNHEDMLLAFLEDERVLETWRGFGGLETLHSYGVKVDGAMAGRDFGAVQRAFAAHLPETHRHFLKNLKVSLTVGDYFFCHAGVMPGVSLDRQDRDDLLTIRDRFLSSKAEHGKLVVHGHTPSMEPEIRPNRIGIDTAAYATNRLTCLVLEQDQRRFLQAGAGR